MFESVRGREEGRQAEIFQESSPKPGTPNAKYGKARRKLRREGGRRSKGKREKKGGERTGSWGKEHHEGIQEEGKYENGMRQKGT